MASQYRFELEASEGQFVGAVVKAAQSLKGLEGGFQQVKHHAKEVHGPVDALKDKVADVGVEVKSMVTGFLGLTGVSEIVNKVIESLKKAEETIKHFQEAGGSALSNPKFLADPAGFQASSVKMSNQSGI